MAARKEVWDLGAEGGPIKLDMFAVDAEEAVKNDPDRYSFSAPDGTIEAEMGAKVRAETEERNRIQSDAEAKVRAADQEAMKAKRDLAEKDREEKAAAKKKELAEKSGEPLSKEARERQIDETARQKGERARQEAGVATGDVKVDAEGTTLRGIPTNGMTTETIPGPVPNRAEQGLDQQIPNAPTPPDRQTPERADPVRTDLDQKPDVVKAEDIKAVEVKPK